MGYSYQGTRDLSNGARGGLYLTRTSSSPSLILLQLLLQLLGPCNLQATSPRCSWTDSPTGVCRVGPSIPILVSPTPQHKIPAETCLGLAHLQSLNTCGASLV